MYFSKASKWASTPKRHKTSPCLIGQPIGLVSRKLRNPKISGEIVGKRVGAT